MKNGKNKRGKRSRSYNRALHVIARMRRTGQTLTAASRDEHIDPRTVRKYLGTELRGPKLKRKVRPTKADRRRRDMLVPTALGTSPVVIRGSKQASELGRYMAAVGKYLRTGESGPLEKFRGKSIGGYVLITDLDTLGALAQAGALQLDQIYALPESSS